MKPNFALDLSHDGIGLLHRAKGGWSRVGEVMLDDPELGEKLAVLRKTATDLEKGGISTKLIIPNSQVLYTTLDTPGPDDIAREIQIREGLEGLTPYKVGELVFDWRPDGKRAHVAVVARETLNEAEGFAKEHRMNPVSFVARPDGGKFKGEPFFGKAKGAAALLGPGEQVDSDPEPIPPVEVEGKARKPRDDEKTDTQKDASAAPKAEETLAAEAKQTGEAPAQAPASPPVEAAPVAAEPEIAAEPKKAPDDETLAAILAEVPAPPGFATSSKADEKPLPLVSPSVASTPQAAPPATPILAPFPPTPDDGDDDESPPRAKPAKAKPAKKAGDPVQATTADATRDAEAPASIPAFTTRRLKPQDGRTEPVVSAKTPSHPAGAPTPQATGSGKPSLGAMFRRTPDAHVPVTAPGVVVDTSKPKAPKPAALSKPGLRGTKLPGFVSAARKGLTARQDTGLPGKSFVANKKANGAAEPETGKPTVRTETAIAPAPKREEAAPYTVFGARQPEDIGGKPKYLGLILTLVLLLLMAIAALWSIFFLGDGDASLFNRDTSNDFANVAAPDVTVPDSSIAALPDPARPATLPAIDGDEDLIMDAEPEPDAEPEAPPADQSGEILSQDAARARYAATGIWQKAPDAPTDPEGDRIDDLYVASIDPKITSHDAVALPPTERAGQDPRPPTPLPPPPLGSQFVLDDSGLVQATPDGTLTPEGVIVYAGKPPVVPPPRPGTVVQPDPAQTEIPRIRPRARPPDLIEGNERANLGGVTRAELAKFRPQPRPTSPQILAAASAPPSDLILSSSAMPKDRPSGFATIVDQARARASASDGSSVVAASAAAITTPSIPTTASVATQATMKNAINLKKVNLIGVYGSASSRRALVRLSNGRYVKVAVGDRLDGGTVTAISATQLIYKKNGKNHTLEVLPLG